MYGFQTICENELDQNKCKQFKYSLEYTNLDLLKRGYGVLLTMNN